MISRLMLLSCWLSILLAAPVTAQEAQEGELLIAGNSRIYFAPDYVSITVSVETHDKDILAAKEANDATVAKIRKYLLDEGIKDAGISIDNMSLRKQHAVRHLKEGSDATTTITIELKEMAKYKSLQVGLVRAGATSIHSVQFLSTKMKQLYDTARLSAVKDAKEKAGMIAKELGTTLGKPKKISISESGYSGMKEVYRFNTFSVGDEDARPTNVYVEAVVNITFRIR